MGQMCLVEVPRTRATAHACPAHAVLGLSWGGAHPDDRGFASRRRPVRQVTLGACSHPIPRQDHVEPQVREVLGVHDGYPHGHAPAVREASVQFT